MLAVLAFAAISKFLDLAAFRTSLDTWLLIPDTLRSGLAIAVPCIESIIVFWYWISRKPVAYYLAGMIIMAFTSVYVLHVLLVQPPDCNCFLKLSAFENWRSSSWGVVPRNGMLICLWAFGLFGLRHVTSAEQQTEVRG